MNPDDAMDALLTGLRAASEPTRLRLLALLARSELSVSDLIRILGQSQPRVSRHLKLMSEAGLIARHQEGAWAFYRLAADGRGAAIARTLLSLLPADDPVLAADRERLDAIRDERAAVATRYFRENAGRWDAIRSRYVGEAEVERAMLEAAGDGPLGSLLDLGTGTGRVLQVFADRIERGLGIDQSREMLAVARAALEARDLDHCQVRKGDLFHLSLAPGAYDLVTIHHVLHFLEDPAAAIREAARTLRTGGRLIVVDFAPHHLEFLRTEHAHRRLGFADGEVRGWCEAAGLGDVRARHLAASGRDDSLTVTLWTGIQRREVSAHYELEVA